MSIKVMAEILDGQTTDKSELLVLLILANYADDNGRCYPSIETVSKKSRLSVRGVQQVVRRLCEKGWLVVSEGGGRGGTNVYTITDKPRTGCTPAPGAPPAPERVNPAPRSVNPAPGADEPLEPVVEVVVGQAPDFLSECTWAAGHNGNGPIPTHWMPPAASLHVNKWVSDLGLSRDECLEVIKAQSKNHETRANGPKAFDRAMQQLAGQKAAPKLTPINGGQANGQQSHDGNGSDIRSTAERVAARVAAKRARASGD